MAKQLEPWGRASKGTASLAMFRAAIISVNTGVSLLIFPLNFAARMESISFMSACCCLILNSTGLALLVMVSGFRSVMILTLFISWGASIQMGVVSLGARSRQTVTSLSGLAPSVVTLLISLV